MIIRSDQEKSTKKTFACFAPLRFKNKYCNSTARCAQEAKRAKKDIMTAG
jgi:hypothetical protein